MSQIFLSFIFFVFKIKISRKHHLSYNLNHFCTPLQKFLAAPLISLSLSLTPSLSFSFFFDFFFISFSPFHRFVLVLFYVFLYGCIFFRRDTKLSLIFLVVILCWSHAFFLVSWQFILFPPSSLKHLRLLFLLVTCFFI